MTYTYEKQCGVGIGNYTLKMEYVESSVSNEIKVVEMWRIVDGVEKEQQMSWMSPESRASLLMELDEDMTDRACRTGEFSLDKYCEENPDFNNAMNGVNV